MDPQSSDNPLMRFLKSKIAMPIGLVLALVVGVALMWLGIDKSCCGGGALVIGLLLFLIPKIFNCKNTKIMIALGAVFFIVATLFGAFAVSSPLVNNNDDCSTINDADFSNVTIEYSSDSNDVTVTVTYSGEQPKVSVEFRPIQWVSYKTYGASSSDDYVHEMTLVGGKYTATFSADHAKLYIIDFKSINAENNTYATSSQVFCKTPGFNDSAFLFFDQEQVFYMQWNAYYAMIPTIMLLLVLLFTAWSKKNLEKTRAKMEAEGRLYPEGYGRCKQCGSIVLPGEVTCRKCGAYVEVPDNMKVKKIDSFQCSECGAEVPGDANVCPKCGAKFDEDVETIVIDENGRKGIESFRCSECGAEVPGDANVCPKCGARFEEEKKE